MRWAMTESLPATHWSSDPSRDANCPAGLRAVDEAIGIGTETRVRPTPVLSTLHLHSHDHQSAKSARERGRSVARPATTREARANLDRRRSGNCDRAIGGGIKFLEFFVCEPLCTSEDARALLAALPQLGRRVAARGRGGFREAGLRPAGRGPARRGRNAPAHAGNYSRSVPSSFILHPSSFPPWWPFWRASKNRATWGPCCARPTPPGSGA